MKMPQYLHPLGAMPEAVFHNQVNHKQATAEPSVPPPPHTLQVERSMEVCSPCVRVISKCAAVALRPAVMEVKQVSSPKMTEQVHHETANSNSTVSKKDGNQQQMCS